MQQQVNSDRRRNARKRMLKGGIIAFSARHATVPCVVRDLSDDGARLQVQNGASVPDTFELIVELDGLEVHAVVVWRKPTEVGVQFLTAPNIVAPKRSQIVASSSAALAKPSLRRNLPGQREPARQAPLGAPAAQPAAAPAARPVMPAAKPAAPAAVEPPALGPAPAALPYAAPAPVKAVAPVEPGSTIPILIADDDPDDRLLIEDAFRESNFQHPIAFVENGEELLEYLRAEGRFAGRKLPGLILLDLNMPRMDGRTALMHMKADRSFRRIPVIVLTTSKAEDDIQRTYDLGVSAYIPKPGSYSGLLDLVQSLNTYWMHFVKLPTP